jgi:hypothetical protein
VPTPDPKRVAAAYLARKGQAKTAGEVIFKKDRGDDASSWAYNDNAPSTREIPDDFNYAPRHQKPLAKILRTTLAALGHTLSGYNKFAKIKSARVSPDGSLGGRGYIQKIADMRKQYMNCIESLSALADTFYDEINAPHWSVLSRQEEDEEKAEVKQLLGDAEMIKQDPQEWAESEMSEEFDSKKKKPELADPDDWDAWGDELEVETTVTDAMQDPNIQRVAAKRSARDVRLALASSRLAAQWLAASESKQLFESLNETLVSLPQKLAGFDWASTPRGAKLMWAGEQVGTLQRYGAEWTIVYQDSTGQGVTHHVASAIDLEEWATALGRYFKEAKATTEGGQS